MKAAIFQYKCRLCGEIHEDAHTSEDNAKILLPCIIYGHDVPKKMFGLIPTIIATHTGCEAGYGVSDLIGYIAEKQGIDNGKCLSLPEVTLECIECNCVEESKARLFPEPYGTDEEFTRVVLHPWWICPAHGYKRI